MVIGCISNCSCWWCISSCAVEWLLVVLLKYNCPRWRLTSLCMGRKPKSTAAKAAIRVKKTEKRQAARQEAGAMRAWAADQVGTAHDSESDVDSEETRMQLQLDTKASALALRQAGKGDVRKIRGNEKGEWISRRREMEASGGRRLLVPRSCEQQHQQQQHSDSASPGGHRRSLRIKRRHSAGETGCAHDECALRDHNLAHTSVRGLGGGERGMCSADSANSGCSEGKSREGSESSQARNFRAKIPRGACKREEG